VKSNHDDAWEGFTHETWRLRKDPASSIGERGHMRDVQGVDAPQDLKDPLFSDDHLMVRAAVAGQGLALIRNVYADDDLRSKRLVQALAVRWPAQFAFHAVATPAALQRPAVRHCRDWLAKEANENPL
jgi:LysR family glycine cleavage system transcriptional activator